MPCEHLEHLPERKRRELARVVQILFDEFEDALRGKLKPEKKLGRILKIILFGSYARGGWVVDRKSGYRSDYDILVVVNAEEFTDQHDYWDKAEERFLRDLMLPRRIRTPVNFIVHSLHDVNDQLARGRPFFTDIARDGIMLYEAPGYPLASLNPVPSEMAQQEAQRHFDQWFPDAVEFQNIAVFCQDRGNLKLAAFNLHQATERLYHCVLLVLTLYSPKSHQLKFLRSRAEGLDARLIPIWPRDNRFARRAFARLQRAYIDARYSPEYLITGEELVWLIERVRALQETVATICAERLDGSDSVTTGT